MSCLLGLSSMHLRRLGRPDVSHARTVAYRAKAFEGYRHAIEKADPQEFPAILACSMLLCSLASQMFRDPDARPLYIIDWMMVWRGIALVVELIKPKILFQSGMALLFMRPPIDGPEGGSRIPPNLSSLITSIPEWDDDFRYIAAYHAALHILGALYRELENDFNPILDLRVISFFTFLPQDFVEMARKKRPRALIIIAHYLPFTKLLPHCWWMDGIANKEILDISDHLGEAWRSHLIVPLAARRIEDKVIIAKLLLDDPEWETAGDDKYHNKRDSRAKSLVFIDNLGRKADHKGNWIIDDEITDSTPPEWESPSSPWQSSQGPG